MSFDENILRVAMLFVAANLSMNEWQSSRGWSRAAWRMSAYVFIAWGLCELYFAIWPAA